MKGESQPFSAKVSSARAEETSRKESILSRCRRHFREGDPNYGFAPTGRVRLGNQALPVQ